MAIRTRYETELKNVLEKLTLMCRHVELTIKNSTNALINRDIDLANEVLEEDKIIDKLERDIETQCLNLLLMEQPFASDFREISSALKMITDLERIGDQARDIAEIVLQFGEKAYIKKPEHISQMAEITIEMVKGGVNSFIKHDVDLARSLVEIDKKVDNLFNTIKKDLIEIIKKNPEEAEQAILFMMIAKYFERIGDHAVNIGEWVEYAIAGIHPKN